MAIYCLPSVLAKLTTVGGQLGGLAVKASLVIKYSSIPYFCYYRCLGKGKKEEKYCFEEILIQKVIRFDNEHGHLLGKRDFLSGC